MKLLSATGGSTTAGDEKTNQNVKQADYVAVQATASGTATTQIQGRLGQDHDWIVLDTITNTDIVVVKWTPFIRAVPTANSADLEVDVAGR